MISLQIRLFGKTSIQLDGQPLSNLPAKALELLGYLLLYRDRAHTRESLSELLWRAASDSLSKKYLRQTLWQLQTTLDAQVTDEEASAEALFILNPGWVCLNPQSTWWLDVDIFERAYALCRDIPGQTLSEQQAQTLEEALSLYQGDLLELWYHDWCIYERERLQLTYLAMLEKLMGYCEAQQHYTKGIAYGQRVLRYDQARESAHRQLMRLYYKAGDRTGALRQYERCTLALTREFNLPPTRETSTLYEQIRADQLVEPPSQPASLRRQAITQAETDLLHELHRQIDQVQASLAAIQYQVRRELAAPSSKLEAKTPQQTSPQTLSQPGGLYTEGE